MDSSSGVDTADTIHNIGKGNSLSLTHSQLCLDQRLEHEQLTVAEDIHTPTQLEELVNVSALEPKEWSRLVDIVKEAQQLEKEGYIVKTNKPNTTSSEKLIQEYCERLFLQQQQQQQQVNAASSHGQGEGSHRGSRKRQHSETEEAEDALRSLQGSHSRKDLSQDERYRRLEWDPFMELAQLKTLYPSVQTRTFYRWKKKIRDQYSITEMNPAMTYGEFCLRMADDRMRAREEVFNRWRQLQSQGRGFVAESSKLLLAGAAALDTVMQAQGLGGSDESQSEVVGRDNITKAYFFLQKNFATVSEEVFFQAYPEVPKEQYKAWQGYIYCDFAKLEANPTVSYQDFQKEVTITEDTFDYWKVFVLSRLNEKARHLMSPCSSNKLGSGMASSNAASLPPGSLLATGAKGLESAWYASYQMGLPFWPPLSLMSHSNTLAKAFKDRSVAKLDTISRIHRTLQDEDVDVETVRNVEIKGSDGDEDNDDGGGGEDVDLDDSAVNDTSLCEDTAGRHSGSRRVSLKPEHLYFLWHPHTDYASLCQLFQGVTQQRYNRWKRKVSSAMLMLSREPNVSDEKFDRHFPNVPSDVLAMWRESVKSLNSYMAQCSKEDPGSALPVLPTHYSQVQTSLPASDATTPSSHESQQCQSRESSLEPETGSIREESVAQRRLEGVGSMQESLAAGRKNSKVNKEEFHFVIRYPSLTLTNFLNHHPTVSQRTFYRWRAKIRKAMDVLRDDPSAGLREVQAIVPEATEEIVTIWRCHLQQKLLQAQDSTHTPALVYHDDLNGENSHLSMTEESQTHTNHASDGPFSNTSTEQVPERAGREEDDGPLTSTAQVYLYTYPHIDFADFSPKFPRVSEHDFHAWKNIVQKVMDYIRVQPTLTYEEVSSAMPHLSKETFSLWQHVVLGDEPEDLGGVNSLSQKQSGAPSGDGHSSSVSVSSVEAGAGKDGQVRDCDLEQMTLLYQAHQEAYLQHSRLQEKEDGAAGKQRYHSKDEMVQVMLRPSMQLSEYRASLGQSSDRSFYRWKANIKKWRALLDSDPSMTFTEFSKHSNNQVPPAVFQVWQSWALHPETSPDSFVADQTAVADHYIAGQDDSEASGGDHLPGLPVTEQFPVTDDPQLASALESLQRNPHWTFEELASLFPKLTLNLYTSWKKKINLCIEYIRLIQIKTYDHFNNIFRWVKEEVFNIWRDIVLEQTTAGTSRETNRPPPVLQDNFLYPASSSSTTGVVSEGQRSEVGSADLNSLSASQPYSATSAQDYYQHAAGAVVSYPNTENASLQAQASTALHSPPATTQASISPARSDSRGSETVRVKLEASPLPSFTETVSNLSGRSAGHWQTQNSSLSHPTLAGYTETHTGGHHSQLSPSAPAAVQTLSQASSAASFHSPGGAQQDKMSPENGGSEDRSMSKPRDKRAAPRGGRAPRERCGGRGVDVMEGEDSPDPARFSSQRKRKLQRQEYIFLMHNPDIEAQEFTAKFPMVSTRTFYRWKADIKADMRTGELNNGAE